MKVLIIGGAGYFGSVTTNYLLQMNHEVTVIDDFRYCSESLLSLCSNTKFHVLKADARDIEFVNREIRNHDIIIPFSAMVGKPLCDKYNSECQSINIDFIEKITCELPDNKWIIYPSTQSCYGCSDSLKLCSENHAVNPLSFYAKSKYLAEQFIMQRDRYYICRFATLFGVSPRMRTDLLINDLVAQAVYKGYALVNDISLYRNYLHVTDGARAIGHIIDNLGDIRSGIYNIGNQSLNCTVGEICEGISSVIPSFKYVVDNSIISNDRRNYKVSMKKIYATGWRPTKSLNDGINELIKAYNMIHIFNYSNL